MTTSKTTKRALLFSVLSLLLCASMLIGSTFAWFTDSVTAGKNKIVAGNLDIGLLVKQGDDYVEVDESKSLFLEGALWEPGHVEVLNLKVANLGTLALKYKFGINIVSQKPGTNKDGATFNLSDYIMFALLNEEKTFPAGDAGRAKAIEAAEAATPKALSQLNVSGNDVLYPEGTEGQKSAKLVTLIVYMPTDIGNIANYKTGTEAPEIELGIKFEATQFTVESDSFGTNYDADAWTILTMTDNHDGTYTGDNNQLFVKDQDAYVPVTESTEAPGLYTTETGDKLYVLDNNNSVPVKKDPGTDGLYTADDGKKYAASADAMSQALATGGNVKTLGDIDIAEVGNPVMVNSSVIDLGDHTLQTRALQTADTSSKGITVQNGNIVQPDKSLYPGTSDVINPIFLYLNFNSVVTDVALKNLNISSTVSTPNAYNAVDIEGIVNKINVTIDDCAVKGTSYFHNSIVTINNSSFDTIGRENAPLFDLNQNVSLTINGGTYRSGENELFSLRPGESNVTITITGGTFDKEIPEAYIADGCTAVDNGDGTWTVQAN